MLCMQNVMTEGMEWGKEWNRIASPFLRLSTSEVENALEMNDFSMVCLLPL